MQKIPIKLWIVGFSENTKKPIIIPKTNIKYWDKIPNKGKIRIEREKKYEAIGDNILRIIINPRDLSKCI
jgi:hypothetical protein